MDASPCSPTRSHEDAWHVRAGMASRRPAPALVPGYPAARLPLSGGRSTRVEIFSPPTYPTSIFLSSCTIVNRCHRNCIVDSGRISVEKDVSATAKPSATVPCDFRGSVCGSGCLCAGRGGSGRAWSVSGWCRGRWGLRDEGIGGGEGITGDGLVVGSRHVSGSRFGSDRRAEFGAAS